MNITPLQHGLPSPPFNSATSCRMRPIFFFLRGGVLCHILFSLYFALFFSHCFAVCSPISFAPLLPLFTRCCNGIHLHSPGGAPFNTFRPSAAAPLPCATSVRMNALPHHLGPPITPYFSIMPNLLNSIPKTNQTLNRPMDSSHLASVGWDALNLSRCPCICLGSPELNQT